MSPSLEVTVSLDEPAEDEQQDRPEKPVCANCRSTEITFDATAYWDAEKQQFEYDIFGDKVLCTYCDGRQRVDWIPV